MKRDDYHVIEKAILRIYYGAHLSPFGNCLLAMTSKGICDLSFFSDGEDFEAVKHLKARWPETEWVEKKMLIRPIIDQIFSENANGRGDKLKLLLRGTQFQLKVWKALLHIPRGLVCSYEYVARMIEVPRSARAVGRAVAANPIAYLIPCHRVIRKNGFIGEYRWGSIRKKAMISSEAGRRFAKN